MKWALYNHLFAAVYPFLLPGFLLRMLRRGGYAARMGDRFALYPEGLFGKNRPLFDSHAQPSTLNPQPSTLNSQPVWIHAVSVGEVQVAGQLMREWRKADPTVRFCFSTTSSTGWMMARKEVKAEGQGQERGDVLIYNPLDFPNFVKSALRTVRPRAIVLTESEIWPNFILKARQYGIPLFLINARVSDRSAPRYRFARWFFKDVLSSFTRIFAQSDLDKERLVAAGAPAEKVDVTGSFKFDVAHRNEAKEKELRAWTGEGRILLGGSTWPGEDEVLLKIYRRLLNLQPQSTASSLRPLLVLAPRHFEKADAVEANIRKAGFACVRRSQPSTLNPQPSTLNPHPVFLADTTGELMGLYGIADVVFVGKSLCAHGSQNMIEPCLCGKPTLVGPYTENFRPVMSDLKAADAIVQVKDAEELEQKLLACWKDPENLGTRAREAVARRLGVVAKCVAEMRRWLALLVLALAVGCSKETSQPETKAELSPPVKEAIYRICKFERISESEHSAKVVDVSEMSAKEFRQVLEAVPGHEVHVWMPGERQWLLIGNLSTNAVSLAKAMEVFAADESCVMSIPELFASYAGTRDDILPAFESRLKGTVVPEWFVTKDIPQIRWLDARGIDEDIHRQTLAEIRSMQVVRRELLRGNMLAAKAKDKKGEEAATEVWARVAMRNPNDPMLLERIDNLNRNAKGFLAVGKLLQAMKCYETIVLVQPKDAAAVHNFGMCLKKLGKQDMAEKVLAHARQLSENPSVGQ